MDFKNDNKRYYKPYIVPSHHMAPPDAAKIPERTAARASPRAPSPPPGGSPSPSRAAERASGASPSL
ncbi:hypothetical protein SISSUDRAFT_649726 [Sistotremastrum suecicum HHB10207 ss-3]|uniref:Uncharacterized protein n=1 Tax=Sistotremastrum suecicum HHB10207 ss-3 TaxID=1314776 RepID=A0A165X5M7_9AGAM|nr:hypothetical protein SISSUDRAFT_649726 [Sistotremastrum suecicum HHB10207 ss-3]